MSPASIHLSGRAVVGAIELPLFPLQTVLFPDGDLQLQIFEQRYLDMVRMVLRQDGRFGVCSIRDGKEVGEPAQPAAVGTLASIVDWKTLPNGLLGLSVQGEDRFQVLSSELRPDTLRMGQVKLLPRPQVQPIPEEYESLLELLEAILKAAGKSGDERRTHDADWVVDRLVEAIPLPLRDRQILLELDQVGDRLDFLVQRLDKLA